MIGSTNKVENVKGWIKEIGNVKASHKREQILLSSRWLCYATFYDLHRICLSSPSILQAFLRSEHGVLTFPGLIAQLALFSP